jgi:hypothetical protein
MRPGRAGWPGGVPRARPTGGNVGDAGGRGHVGGAVKLAAASALNSSSSHCGPARISSANFAPCRCRNLCHLAGCSAGRWLLGHAPARAWDDLRLVGLKLIFLIVTRAVSLLGLSRREWWWKDAEILMLRHQLAVAERERPRAHSRLTLPDRAWLALLAGTVPVERLAAMRLIVTPGTVLRCSAASSAAGGRACRAGAAPGAR